MKANYRQIPDLLAARKPFEGNTMRAATCLATGFGLNNWGRPNAFPESDLYEYVVFSYSTPIAAVTTEGEVIIPDTKYSVTTSRQQNLCRAWLKGGR